jgi:hypothetical protein
LTYSVPVSTGETIVHCKNYHLSWRELYILRPKTWLDDNILSTISDAITLLKRKMDDSVSPLSSSFLVFSQRETINSKAQRECTQKKMQKNLKLLL